MAKIFYESDCDLSLLDGKTVAIIGYGPSLDTDHKDMHMH